MKLFEELKRRRVFKVAGIYVVAMFATLQGAQVLVASLSLPAWSMTMLTLIALVALPIVVILSWVLEVTQDGVKRAEPTPQQGRSVAYVGVGILIALVGVGAYLQVQPARTAAPAAGAAEAAGARAIAVLPFVNMSADPEQEYFSDGLTEELLNALAQVPELRVAARTSSFAFKGKNVPVADIARTLNVTTVLEGSVRKAGNQVRITAQLIDAASGHHLWSQTYDRELTDIFAIQEEISRSITDALKIELGAKTSSVLAAHATDNIEAYNLFLQGRHFWNKRSPDGLKRARQLLERALELDPNFARAHAALADVYSIGMEYAGFPVDVALKRGREAALRAIALDSTLAEPHAALGQLAERALDWAGADAELKRAIELNPNYATAHQWYAWQLMYRGEQDEGLRVIRKALELDPLSQIINLNVAEHLLLLGRSDEAIKQLHRLSEIDPDFTMVWNDFAWAYAIKGDFAKSREYAERVLAMPGARSPYELSMSAYALAKGGDPVRARELIRDMEERGMYAGAAAGYLGLGENERAIAAAEKSVATHEPMAVGLILTPDPLYTPIANHPRMQALVRKLRPNLSATR